MKKLICAPVLVVLLCLLFISCGTDDDFTQQQLDNQEIISNYEELTDTLISNNKVPGLIVGVWAPDRNLIWIKAKGKANIASGDLMKEYYHFRIGSITNKDRLCEERTTILSIGWTSPAHEQVLFI